MTHLDWDSLRFVLALSETGSYAAAGRALKVTHVTIMRRIAALETDLGVKLFDRSNEGFSPTTAGREMASYAALVREGIESLERRLEGQDRKPAGLIRLTTTDTLFYGFLGSALGRLTTAFPQIRYEISTSNEFLNLRKGEADIAIRPSNAPPDTLIGRRVSTIAFAVYGAPWLASAIIPPTDEASIVTAMGSLPWLGLGDDLKHLAAWQWLSANVPLDKIASRIDSLMALNHAVSCGLGIGVLPCFLAEGNPNLVRISPVLKNVSTDIWILCHQDLRSLPRIRTVTTFLANAFRLAQSKFNPESPSAPNGGLAPETSTMTAPSA